MENFLLSCVCGDDVWGFECCRRILNFEMLSWSSINSETSSSLSSSSTTSSSLLTPSIYEFNLLKEYEDTLILFSSFTSSSSSSSSFSSSSSISSITTHNFSSIKEKFYSILLKLNNLIDSNKYKKKLKYLCLKNLSLIKEKEKDYLNSLKDALEALQEGNINDELVLLIRIAYLSIYSKQLSICYELLYFGHLSKAIRPILFDLHYKYSKALLQEGTNNFIQSIQPTLKSASIINITIPPTSTSNSTSSSSSSSLSTSILSILECIKLFSSFNILQIKEYIESRYLEIHFIFQASFDDNNRTSNNNTNNTRNKTRNQSIEEENYDEDEMDLKYFNQEREEEDDEEDDEVENSTNYATFNRIRKSTRQMSRKHEFESQSNLSQNSSGFDSSKDSVFEVIVSQLESYYMVIIFILILDFIIYLFFFFLFRILDHFLIQYKKIIIHKIQLFFHISSISYTF